MGEYIKILEGAIGIVEEMLERAKIKNIKILLPVEERAIEIIIQAYKDQKCKADIQDATIKNMQDFMEQLEKELEPIRELGIPVETVVAELNRLEDLEDDREQIIQSYKELEEKSIPKDVIREKLRIANAELEKEKQWYSNLTERKKWQSFSLGFSMGNAKALEELLGGSNE